MIKYVHHAIPEDALWIDQSACGELSVRPQIAMGIGHQWAVSIVVANFLGQGARNPVPDFVRQYFSRPFDLHRKFSTLPTFRVSDFVEDLS
jgi:hypothetical protein